MKTLIRITWFILLLLSLTTQPIQAQGGDDGTTVDIDRQVKFEHLTPDDGLSSRFVNSIIQDNQGFMWFGTANGLNRYDGYEFTIYRHDPQDPNSLSTSTINMLWEDRAGRLWIATQYGLNLFNRQTGQFSRYLNDPTDSHSLNDNRVRRIYEDSQGNLWLGTRDGGLNLFDPARETFTRYQHDPQQPGSLSNNHVEAIYEDHQGVLWVGTMNGLNRFDPDRQTFRHYQADLTTPGSLSHNSISSIYEDRNHNLWIGTLGGGLNQFDRQTEQFTHWRHDETDPHSLSMDTISFISEDKSGMLWIGTLGGGLNRFDRQTEQFTRYLPSPSDPDSLSDVMLLAFWEDRAGALWFGNGGSGIDKYDPLARKFALYRHQPNDPHSLSSNQINGIYEDSQGLIWLGTTGGGLNRFDPQTEQFTHFIPDENNPASVNIFSIYEDSRQMLWISTWGSGLYRFDRETETFTGYQYDPTNPQSLSHNIVTSMVEDEKGNLWVGTWEGGLNYFDRQTETFTHYRNEPNNPFSLGDDRIIPLHRDRAGNLWLGLVGKGLARFDPTTERFITFQESPKLPVYLSQKTVTSIFEDRAGILWLGIDNNLIGLDWISETFRHYRPEDGLPNGIITCIQGDQQGNLWISTEAGLSRFNPQTETFRNYDTSDGLQGLTFRPPACAASRTGELFFGGLNGLNRFDPATLTDNPYIPPVVLTGFQLFHESVPVDDDSPLPAPINQLSKIVLPYHQNLLSFEFAALNYTASEKNQYAYRMTGVDKSWVYVDSDQRLASYTNLSPGRYTFQVTGSNNDELWNETAKSIEIIITPPWWETAWFQLAMFALGLGFVFGAYRWRVSSIERQRQLLARQVAERTAELRESERAMTTLLANLPGMAYRCRNDHHWSMAFISEGCYDLTGYPASALLNNAEVGFGDLIHPDDQEHVWEAVQTAVSQHDSFQLVYRLITKTGQERWLWEQGQGLYNDAGQLIALEGFITDVTARKEAEDALQESETRFRTAFENASVGMCLVSMTGKLLRVNRQMGDIFGYDHSELEGMNVNDITHPDYRDISPTFINRAVSGEVARAEFEKQYIHSQGHLIWGQVTSSLVSDAQGNPLYFISHVQDITDSRRVEETLRKLSRAVEQSGNTIVITDLTGRIEFVNPAFTTTTGYTTEEALGQNPRILKSGKLLPELYKELWNTISQGQVWQGELHNKKKNGELFWESAIISPVKDDTGKVTHYVAVKEDITARKQTETALRESEERFAAVMNSMQALMYVADMETYEILFVNEYTRRHFGDIEGQICWQVLQKDQTDVCEFCTNKYLVKNNKPTGVYTWEFQNTLTGQWYQIQDQAIRWVDGRLVRLEIATNITDLKRAEAALRESEAKYRLLTENTDDVIWTTNNELQFTYISPSIQGLRGLTPEEARQETIEATMTPASFARIQQAYEASLAAEAEGRFDVVSRLEVEQYHRDGSTVWVESVSRPMVDELGQKVGYVGVSRNITQRKQSDKALQEAKQMAEEAQRVAEKANQAKSMFLANMSHELRTPLNAILGFSELMMSDANLTDEQRENMATIIRSGDHLLALINDVLEFSKIEAGRHQLQPELFDLPQMVLGLAQMFRLRARQKGLRLIFEVSPDLPQYVRADQNKLRQVLINLLSNAVKFTAQGSIILQVSWSANQQPNDPSVSPSVTTCHLNFAVEDTGIGIDPAELEQVFDPFVQTSSGQQSKQGTGLGMTISREFVRLMGGELSVISPISEMEDFPGTRFEFYLPVDIVEDETIYKSYPHRQVIGLEPGQPTYRLLVVEDIEASRRLLVKLLQPLKLEIREAVNGIEAVEIWQSWQPHLIFMDMRLPGIDGREATKWIKQTPTAQETIIVAVTAGAFEEERAAVLALGCDDFIRKPYHQSLIIEALEKHLGLRFIYEAESARDTMTSNRKLDLSTVKAALSPALRQQLGQALVTLDMAQINQSIELIRQYQAPLADQLACLAYEFDYEKMLDLVAPELKEQFNG